MAMDYGLVPREQRGREELALGLLRLPLEGEWDCEDPAGRITARGYKSTLLYFAFSPRDKRDCDAVREFLWEYSPVWEKEDYPMLERLTDSQIDYVLDEIGRGCLMSVSFGFSRQDGDH